MSKPRRKFSTADVRKAIEAVGASPKRIAAELNCSTGTVHTYIRKYDEIRAAYEKAKGNPVDENPQFSKDVFEKAIKDSHGVKAAVAAAVNCSRQTVDNALKRWPELVEQLDSAKSTLIGKATSALVKDVENSASDGHQRAYMFVLKTWGKDEGFVERSEVTGADGAGLLDVSPELAEQVKALGLNLGEVLRNLVAMRQQELGVV